MTSPLDELHNYLQKRKMPTALSWFDSPSGPKHEVKWTSTCKVGGVGMGTGSASTKKAARTVAAEKALAEMKSKENETAASGSKDNDNTASKSQESNTAPPESQETGAGAS